MFEEFIYCNAGEADDVLHFELAGTSFCDGSYAIRRECAGTHVLEYVERGGGTIRRGGNDLRAVAGCAYVLRRGEPHAYFSSAQDPWVKHFVNVRGTLADGLIEAYGLETGVYPDCPVLDRFQTLFALLHTESVSSNARALHMAFHELIASIAASRGMPELSDAEKIRRFLDENIRRPLRLRDIAGYVYKSPSQINRIFKDRYGQTPYDYFIRRRLQNAAMLLRETNMSMRQIALELCFTDEHYFSNAFRQLFGEPPGKYREKGRGTP